MSTTLFLRTLAGAPQTWARLAQRMGECKRGDAFTARTLSDDIGSTMVETLQLLQCWEGLGWVRSAKGAFGYTHWEPTGALPSVDRLEVSDQQLASMLLSAVLTVQGRGMLGA